MKNIVVLGSSGSIGKNALWVISRFPEEFNVFGLSVHRDTRTLLSQIKEYRPRAVCVSYKDRAEALGSPLPEDTELFAGPNGLEDLASHPDVDIVLNAVSGFAGLRPTLAAARAGKRVALANKESMVAGGELVNKTVAEYGAEIIPVDSEHSAIFQCLKAGNNKEVRRLILTSSGGPFREFPKEKMSEITVEQALNHPTWKMGKKITIDSATMMNKGLEVIEAVFLFSLPPEKVDVVIHPQSFVHSMVEFIDGSIIAQLSKPDMCLPVQYALFYPQRREMNRADLDFTDRFSLEFEPPDNVKFPGVELAREALKRGGTAPVVFNASNEAAVDAFLNRKIKFTDIFHIVEKTMNKSGSIDVDSIESIMEADKNGRKIAEEIINGIRP
ncbi:MAG: 1-deoxy-D-xylulose-5-phosphate reductoisomerase [Candidatus Zixiibacteriota bacterium]|nr:MAG: 1-deoxy-D-xylulose-5-phosphate reductoisomerase [candidate division Zixibacteria bacterium]